MRFVKDPSYSYLQRGDAICLRLRIVGPGAHRFEIVQAQARQCVRPAAPTLQLRAQRTLHEIRGAPLQMQGSTSRPSIKPALKTVE